MYGCMDKLLWVDLSRARITQTSIRPYAGEYLGGRGVAAKIYAETVAPEVKAFDPENRLIFMNGALVACGAHGTNRMTVAGKSPGLLPEGYCYGNIGGFFGAELKKAGYDGIVIQGRAEKPVYLFIHNNEVELRDASSLWGQRAYKTSELLQQAHGEKVRFVTTGPAGENRVRAAIIFGSHQATCIGGFGAVMGSKNLKAIAVLGTGKPSVADPAGLKELNQYTLKLSKRISLGIPPGVGQSRQGREIKIIGRGGCYQCALECIRNVYRYSDNLEGNRRCQAMGFYLPSKYSQESEPVETFFNAPTMANDYSIDTMELMNINDWLYACCNAGVLSEQETGLPLSRLGTKEYLEKLLHSISYREGIGSLLADGLWRAREKISDEARALIPQTHVPVGLRDTIPPRGFVVQALLYPMEPRGNQAVQHEVGQIIPAWSLNQQHPDRSPVTTKVIHEIARAFWDSDEAADFSSYEGKALAAKIIQNRCCMKDSLGLCDYTWPMMYSFNTPDHVGDPELEAKTFSVITGIKLEKKDLLQYGERIFNLERVIMLREGRKVPEADFPLEYNFTQPLQVDGHGRKVMVPGPGGTVIDATGKALDRGRYMNMLKEYYRLRGWDEETGCPKAETLANLGLDNPFSTAG